MDFVFITGKLGQGKTLIAVSKIKERFERGGRVATNVDINLTAMFHRNTDKPKLTRIPDKPTLVDFEAIGKGYDMTKGYDESKNGLLVLDECGTWFNARNWQDKTRSDVNNWFLHARKLGWDVFLIVQDMSIIDSQARESLAAGVARCKRIDKFRIPFLSAFTSIFLGFILRPPKLHSARVEDDSGLLLDRWMYRGTDLYAAYDTRQAFRTDYPHAVHSVLTPWHIHGRHAKPMTLDRKMRITKIYLKRYSKFSVLVLGVFAGVAASYVYALNILTPEPYNFLNSAQDQAKQFENPKPFDELYNAWSYDGSMTINGRTTYFLVNDRGIRTTSHDDLFQGITFSEPSHCVLKLFKGSDFAYIKCPDQSDPKKSESDLSPVTELSANLSL